MNSRAQYGNSRTSSNILRFKLTDLMSMNQTIIDYLYAQFTPNSNQINFIYQKKMPKNSPPYSLFKSDNNPSLSNGSYYFMASLDSNHEMSPGMDSLLLGEIWLLLFILFIWILSVYIFVRRYKLVLCGESRDIPFYKSAVLNKTNEKLDNNSLVPLTSFVNSKSSDGFSTNGSLDECDEFSDTATTYKSNGSMAAESLPQNKKQMSNATTISNETELHVANSFYQLRQHRHAGSQRMGSCRKKLLNRQNSRNQQNSLVSNTIGIKKEISLEMTTTTNNSFINSKSKEIVNRTQSIDSSDYYYSNGLVYSSILSAPSSFLKKIPKSKKNRSLFSKSFLSFKENIKKKESCPENIYIRASYNSQCNLNGKQRVMLNKNHAYLSSLDETALGLYRKEHRINVFQRPLNQNKSQKGSTRSRTSASIQPSTMTTTMTINPPVQKKSRLGAPNKDHANFISLRCDDTVTKNWLKPYYTNPDKKPENQDIDENSNSEQSLMSNSASSFRAKNEAIGSSSASTFIQRAINPKSSIRRYMFINSKRGERNQTTCEDVARTHSRSYHSDTSDATKECDDIYCKARSSTLIAQLNQPDKAEVNNSSCLLDPALISPAVKTSLLELHDIVCTSKSDSNIKSKRQNNLLRPPVVAQKASALDKKSIFKGKKAFSLQIASDAKKVTYRDKNAAAEESVLIDRIVADCHTNNNTLPFSMDSSVENLINNK